MSSRSDVVEELLRSSADGTLTSFRVPGGGDLIMGVTGPMLSQALSSWDVVVPERRRAVHSSVMRQIKRSLKKIKRGVADQTMADEFAQDCALWFAYELKFYDGTRHIVETPSLALDMLKKAAN